MVVEQTVAGRMETLRASMPGIGDYFERSRYEERAGQPGVADFAFGVDGCYVDHWGGGVGWRGGHFGGGDGGG